MQRRFATLDVFTGNRFAGNPLAVVLDAEGLDAAAMQTIAREFGHPETVFTLPSTQPGTRARLRIFTPARELPFAGHPTVGTAVLLGLHDGGLAGQVMVLEEAIGPVRCVIERAGTDTAFACFTAPPAPTEAGTAPDDAKITAALNIAPSDVGFARYRPSRWSAGNAFTFVPVTGLAAIRRCRPDPAAFEAAFGAAGMAYVFCAETEVPGRQFHARMFSPGSGIPEDPATGSAAAALPGVIARYALPGDGTHTMLIEQGYEMGRPSLIELTMAIAAGTLGAVSIGGEAVVVTSGSIEA
jgi:trans-2,3-dihydro-3-hydroxyanthranilate isomerase